ncbi:hypothetical protein B0I35DRAFT_397230 [Stachybotrys elegans]|uniref:Zn(2)-C6 fungal-type domain-containing protein n=1 Tax=Stachybotrys elegans TaxID=80388 RepID=A0A8K0SFL9_9HYPO|nr:hypothetical protein B0I35DRAFT_397230 [Stachybotrys elegans]
MARRLGIADMESLTCRERHVKCDETRPTCGQCLKQKDRPCRWHNPSPQLKIRQYQPKRMDEDSQPVPEGEMSSPDSGSIRQPSAWQDLQSPAAALSTDLSQDEFHPYSDPSPMSVWSPNATLELSRQEAYYLHHFSTHLARWLDCTDASRQFALNVTTLAKSSSILLYAIISYAAHHLGDGDTADESQEKCIQLLIPSLSTEVATHEAILCAIVILRVCEQLSVTVMGSDQERHLAGLSALLKKSQGRQVDPSAPTLSQAAFWVYVRQCLYNACVNQQPPNLDFDLVVMAPPHEGADVKSETAWANTMTWICATVVHFCFQTTVYLEPSMRLQRWYELSEAVENWNRMKPSTFEPIWSGEGDPFPEIFFTADWHVMAFGFYHLARMLLKVYRPSTRFAIRNIQQTMPESDVSYPKRVTTYIDMSVCHGTCTGPVWFMQKLSRNCTIPHYTMSFYIYLGALDDR